uniref:NADH dehydrogenase subunit 6 n=1 Tax=Themus foveicollis TaxID=3035637 RepID=UPI0025520C79|nr:NADH dehydrogenase subunit 6 [Themus foveicollis]WFS86431.1 NADH dehydrogenase subunit 6 [Themus foveicollis]
MMMTLTLMMIFLAITPLFLKHPITMGLNLLIQTIVIALITGFMALNFWMSYLIFLVMIGGMLILFMYMTSIASNEKFVFSKILLIILVAYSMMFLSIMIFNVYEPFSIKNIDSNEFIKNSLYEFSPNKYFMNNSKFILAILIIYLFITLIAIVSISSNSFGPLRQNL